MKVYVVLFKHLFADDIRIDSLWLEKSSADLRREQVKWAWVEEHDLEDLP